MVEEGDIIGEGACALGDIKKQGSKGRRGVGRGV